jgi:hypothetical protein
VKALSSNLSTTHKKRKLGRTVPAQYFLKENLGFVEQSEYYSGLKLKIIKRNLERWLGKQAWCVGDLIACVITVIVFIGSLKSIQC